ncbi:MAG TPA: transcriptional repressor LexA [Acidimicrobiia bacterium]|nr:transcriptional repressor LexA [Acidimicrobiia bacterium]
MPRDTEEPTRIGGDGVLSGRQRQVLDYIRDTVADRGYPPSVREIGDAIGLSSPSTVHSHLSTLVKLGYIRRDPTKPRAIEVLGGSEPGRAAPSTRDDEHLRDVPLVGRIAAGSPILAAEHVENVMALPTELVGNGPIFMLEVRGDSMIDAGIFDGDYVVVRRQDHAMDGEIIAALIDGEEATVKRLRRAGGKVMLISENPAYEPMIFERDVNVIGKVVTVLRKLG